jgi:cyclically-permuted mutarotase family protein
MSCKWGTCFRWFSFLLIFLITTCSRREMENLQFYWKPIPPIPPKTGDSIQPGLAGPVTGSLGELMLVAGGANFPDGPPWKGGVKQYHDEVFLLRLLENGSFSWAQSDKNLPVHLAYSAVATIPGGVISIGGENELGPVKDVFLFSACEGNIDIKRLPDLPAAISSGGAASVGSKVFVAGGLNIHGASAGFYCLDIQNPNNGWEVLPDLPVPLSHAVVLSQWDESGPCIFVIGGRNKTGEISTFFSGILKYSPVDGSWSKETDININGKPVGLSAGTGIAFGPESIILFGGDKGIVFNQTERINLAIEKSSGPQKVLLLEKKDSLLTNHSGFYKGILVYNTFDKSWRDAGEIPGETPVTTSAFVWKGMVIIPSGEVRPGIRSSKVLGVEIVNQQDSLREK